ncbi:CDP-glycerol glycerophosphotransferase family protein [Candidatus Parcubacteria bacterium]|nr:CDP-glycerol glycerophosphotransferase family protein [Candidatus Parcubacteria bacterium]
MKTILINFNNSFFVRNFLRTDTLQCLLRRDIRLVLLTSQEKVDYYKKEFPHKQITYLAAPKITRFPAERFFKFIEMASIHTETVKMMQRSEFYRSELSIIKRIYLYALRRLFWFLGQFRWWRTIVRFSYYRLPSQDYKKFLDEYRPDLVYSPTTVYADNRLIKEAKKRGILTAAMVLSWDNFYSKSILRVHSDWLLVHTASIKKQAENIGDYPGDKIIVTGLPQYDRYFNKQGILPREDFIQSISGDPKKKLIVYAFSGKVGLQNDFRMITILSESVRKNSIYPAAQILVRPYPRYDLSEGKLDVLKKKYPILGVSAMSHVGLNTDNWEFDEHSLNLLTNTLYHADVIITTYSTFFIEGAIFDKPLIGISFDGKDKLSYHESARRFFDWDHLRDIKKYDAITLVCSEDELIGAINKSFANPAYRADGRKKMVKTQSEFQDGKSGLRVAEAILHILHHS